MPKTLTDAVSADNLMQHTRNIAQWVRLSGTVDERQAFDYVRSQLDAFGFATTIHASEALIGYPGESSLEVVSPEGMEIPCNGYSFSPSTPAEGIEADLVYVGNGTPEDLRDKTVRGKIIISEGLATPSKALAAMQAGAIGQIHINGPHIHEMCISPVWGTPVPETSHLLPAVPAIGITESDGQRLKDLLSSSSVSVKIRTRPYRQWTAIPTLIADLPGQHDDRFVLFSGHIDSWHYGAMDNGTANATQIEVGRLLAEHRSELRRGVRLAFWSGHSHGRYAGSTWYADQFWQDLHDHCVCHVNVDSVGAVTADVLDGAPTMAESWGFARDVLQDTAGSTLAYHRISRSGDQSFWGHGIPSLFISLSEQVNDGSPAARAMEQLLGSGGGLGWWWHTTEDTLDKVDPDNLLRDARVYAETLWRLCTDERLPFDYAAAAREMVEVLTAYNDQAGSAFDLSGTIALAEDLAAQLESLGLDAVAPDVANGFLMDLGRLLIPVNYTRSGPFFQDLALGTAPLPGLIEIGDLTRLEPASDDSRFLSVKLLRERNRIEHALIEARRRIDRLSGSAPYRA